MVFPCAEPGLAQGCFPRCAPGLARENARRGRGRGPGGVESILGWIGVGVRGCPRPAVADVASASSRPLLPRPVPHLARLLRILGSFDRLGDGVAQHVLPRRRAGERQARDLCAMPALPPALQCRVP
eukprot:1188768-Alexandrium_andersonii.AAC.1